MCAVDEAPYARVCVGDEVGHTKDGARPAPGPPKFGALLKADSIVAVRVPPDQRRLWPEEGDYWLVHIDSEAFEAPADLVHSTDEIEEGWLIANGRFYSKEQKSPNGYKLAPESQRRPFVVNSMIRLPGVAFAGKGRTPRSGLLVLEDDQHHVIQGCV